jgi:hypothetical protein
MLRADEVARYLQDNPKFFEDYADLLTHFYIPHPHGGRAISITERQVIALRDKTKQLEAKLAELIRFGEENDAIAEKVQRLAAALVAAGDRDDALRTLYFHLREDFAVPHVAVRIWGFGDPEAGPEFNPVGEQTRIFAAGLAQAYCGPASGFEAVSWFGQAGVSVRSLAMVGLRREAETFGLLALGSEDAQRFYPDMGTLYLLRIGELAAAALARDNL